MYTVSPRHSKLYVQTAWHLLDSTSCDTVTQPHHKTLPLTVALTRLNLTLNLTLTMIQEAAAAYA